MESVCCYIYSVLEIMVVLNVTNWLFVHNFSTQIKIFQAILLRNVKLAI